MSLLRKVFGVSWKTHEASRQRIRDLEVINESLRKGRSSETKGKLKFEGLYNQEKQNHDECAKERKELRSERDTVIDINRNLGRELHRLRELFSVTFSSKRARELVLENRCVSLEALRKLTGGHKFSAKHVAAVIAMVPPQERGLSKPDGKPAA